MVFSAPPSQKPMGREGTQPVPYSKNTLPPPPPDGFEYFNGVKNRAHGIVWFCYTADHTPGKVMNKAGFGPVNERQNILNFGHQLPVKVKTQNAH
jgi:hypothetical protein